ncbi:BnaC09g18590D [Brassica napus]|uniref:BnaC09g18590D protein n=1 Tax=Brassica napus TaxID=3708 RepID=A0A078G9K2_BRANA|nr:BnaC09g18590D [Brassica napus]
MKHNKTNETGGSCIRRTFKNNGKLKVASSELATRAQTLPPGLNRRRLIVEKSFAAGEAPEDVKSRVYSVLTPKLRQDLLLAVSIFAGSTTAKDLKRFCTYRNSSVCSPTVRIIAFQAIDPGSTTVRHTELYRGSKNSETTLILTDARGQQVLIYTILWVFRPKMQSHSRRFLLHGDIGWLSMPLMSRTLSRKFSLRFTACEQKSHGSSERIG